MKSGPLAGAEAVEKGAKGEKSCELVAHFGEWTTLKSGPLARAGS
ncbi:hypothetical protein GCWU000182_00694 [Abiotrophia defectiva ATCC 49176]|uniref:Uncharacterized protein n=1 Tax=Abiotrophia defectiva ATCC 49176 TaxID=592010 RepID=W1Q403_ABIDE|nr:hypothetical protein GCWU000182_00694 [Abiotrophia defectiva ATCC 49176]